MIIEFFGILGNNCSVNHLEKFPHPSGRDNKLIEYASSISHRGYILEEQSTSERMA